MRTTNVLQRLRSASIVVGGWVALSVAVGAQPGRPKAEAIPVVETDGILAGTSVRLALRVALPNGVHVQADKPRDPALIPTVLTLDPTAGITVDEIVYPKPTDLKQSGQGEPLAVFEQNFVVGVRVTVDRNVALGDVIVPARLRYQACDASVCFAPTRDNVQWMLRVVPPGSPTPRQYADLFGAIQFRQPAPAK
jgi:DsbC/DsbD-like thiol-disulfide interchange protein